MSAVREDEVYSTIMSGKLALKGGLKLSKEKKAKKSKKKKSKKSKKKKSHREEDRSVEETNGHAGEESRSRHVLLLTVFIGLSNLLVGSEVVACRPRKKTQV